MTTTSTTVRSALADEMRSAAQALGALAAGERLDFALDQAERDHDLAPASRPVVRDLAYSATRVLGLCQALARGLNAREPAPPVAALQWLALAQLIAPQRHPATIVDQAVRRRAPILRPRARRASSTRRCARFCARPKRCWMRQDVIPRRAGITRIGGSTCCGPITRTRGRQSPNLRIAIRRSRCA